MISIIFNTDNSKEMSVFIKFADLKLAFIKDYVRLCEFEKHLGWFLLYFLKFWNI